MSEIRPLEINQVRGSDLEPVYNSLISEYHYLGYCHPIGEHLKYVLYWNNRPISCLAFSSSPRHIGARDKYIGWNKDIRTRNETFVDTQRFHGTCYKAANWRYLGLTTGRGKNDQTHKPNRSIKAVWGYPLHKNFREALTEWT